MSLQSGFGCSPAPELIVPSRNSNQRPISSSRVMICATKLRSVMRFQNASCRRALYLSISDRPNRMSESLVVASIMVSSCRTPILNSANDLDAGRAQLARARSVRHNALDLACTQGDERRNAANQRFVNACAWLRKTEAAQHSAIAVEDRRADTGAAGIDLAMCDADAGAPEARERAAELIEAPAEPCCCNLVGVVGEQRFQGAGRQVRQDDLGGGAAIERHRPPALVAHRLLRAAAHDLVHAHDAIMEQAAQDGGRALDRMLDEIDQHGAGRDQHRIGGLDLPLHLDDGRPERVASARDRSNEARAGELLEIAVGGLG